MENGAATSLLSVLLSLLLIIGLILALAWFLRRFGQVGSSRQGAMRVVASLALGTRERLLLVQVGEQQLLLGVTPQQVRTLHVFDEPVVDPNTGPGDDFRQRLMGLMKQSRNRS